MPQSDPNTNNANVIDTKGDTDKDWLEVRNEFYPFDKSVRALLFLIEYLSPDLFIHPKGEEVQQLLCKGVESAAFQSTKFTHFCMVLG